jgi:hypothetical protein
VNELAEGGAPETHVTVQKAAWHHHSVPDRKPADEENCIHDMHGMQVACTEPMRSAMPMAVNAQDPARRSNQGEVQLLTV